MFIEHTKSRSFIHSKHKPSKAKDSDAEYFTLNLEHDKDWVKNVSIDAYRKHLEENKEFPIVTFGPTGLANLTVDRGEDENGEYFSVYDKYDFAVPGAELVGNPYEIYDRYYITEDDKKSMAKAKENWPEEKAFFDNEKAKYYKKMIDDRPLPKGFVPDSKVEADNTRVKTDLPKSNIGQGVDLREKARNLRGGKSRQNPDGSSSTVLMTQMDNKAFPTLFHDEERGWYELPADKALEEAKVRNEIFEFDTEEQARAFAEGSWKEVKIPNYKTMDFSNSKKSKTRRALPSFAMGGDPPAKSDNTRVSQNRLLRKEELNRDEDFYKSAGYRALMEGLAAEQPRQLATGRADFDPLTQLTLGAVPAGILGKGAPMLFSSPGRTAGQRAANIGMELVNPLTTKGTNAFPKSAKEIAQTNPKSVFRAVRLNDEIRNLPGFKGKTDDEILDIMGTTITGGGSGRRKGSFNQALNTAGKESAFDFGARRWTDGERYLLEVLPDEGVKEIVEPKGFYINHIRRLKDARAAAEGNARTIGKKSDYDIPEEFFQRHGEGVFTYPVENFGPVQDIRHFVGREGSKMGKVINRTQYSYGGTLPKYYMGGGINQHPHAGLAGMISDFRSSRQATPPIGMLNPLPSMQVPQRGMSQESMAFPRGGFEVQGASNNMRDRRGQAGQIQNYAYGGMIPEYSRGGNIARSTLGGAASGAATGASIGSVIPGIGTAIGTGVGAVVGGLKGFFTGRNQEDAKEDAENEATMRARQGMQTAKLFADTSELGTFPTMGVTGVNYYTKYGGAVKPEYMAEGGEVLIHNEEQPTAFNGALNQLASNMSEIQGPSHDAAVGGTEMMGGDFVLSKRMKATKELESDLKNLLGYMPSDNTYAGISKSIGNKKGKLEAKLESNDPIAIRTAEVMMERYDEALELVALEQENRKNKVI